MLRPPKVLLYFFFVFVSYYYAQCYLTAGRYFSSVHFLYRNTALPFSSVFWGSSSLPGTGPSWPAQSVLERPGGSSGRFLRGAEVRVRWSCAAAAKLVSAVVGRTEIKSLPAQPDPPGDRTGHLSNPCHFKLVFLAQTLLILPAATILWFG